MTTRTVDKDSLIDVLILTLIAGAGGGVAYLQRYLDGGYFRASFFISQIIVSGFCGGLVGFAVTRSWPQWGYMAAGVAGIFGIQLIYLMFNIWLRLAGRQAQIETSDLELRDPSQRRPRRTKI